MVMQEQRLSSCRTAPITSKRALRGAAADRTARLLRASNAGGRKDTGITEKGIGHIRRDATRTGWRTRPIASRVSSATPLVDRAYALLGGGGRRPSAATKLWVRCVSAGVVRSVHHPRAGMGGDRVGVVVVHIACLDTLPLVLPLRPAVAIPSLLPLPLSRTSSGRCVTAQSSRWASSAPPPSPPSPPLPRPAHPPRPPVPRPTAALAGTSSGFSGGAPVVSPGVALAGAVVAGVPERGARGAGRKGARKRGWEASGDLHYASVACSQRVAYVRPVCAFSSWFCSSCAMGP